LLVNAVIVLAQTTGTAEPQELYNPLGPNRDLSVIIGGIIKNVLGLLGVLALVMFIYGGLLWMTSGGKEEQVKKGRETLVWAAAGLALIFFSYAILNFVLNVLVKTSGQ